MNVNKNIHNKIQNNMNINKKPTIMNMKLKILMKSNIYMNNTNHNI